DTFATITEEVVRGHLRDAVPAAEPILIKGRSTEYDADSLLSGVLRAPPRFISVDGSHETHDVLWDLALAEQMLATDGIVALDDFLNPLALGVNEAANRFFSVPRQLVPFAYIANKLFLARPGLASTLMNVVEIAAATDQIELRSRSFQQRLAEDRCNVKVS